jgi:hypothetical protein
MADVQKQCTCALASNDSAASLHAEQCQLRAHVSAQETYEAKLLADQAYAVLRSASNERVAAAALHVTMAKLAATMNTTPLTMAETMVRVAKEIGDKPS